MAFCKNCGTQLREGDIFCDSCGTKQEIKTTQSVVQANPPTPDSGNSVNVIPVNQNLPASSPPVYNQTVYNPPVYNPPVSPPPATQQAGPQKTNWGIISVIGVLLVGVIVLGALFGIGSGNLSKAKADIVNLEIDVAGLQTQLTAEQTLAADLQTQLTAAKDQVSSLTADLAVTNGKVTSLTADLATASGKVTSLTADLATANGKITSLTADLATANGKVTSLTADLATANGKVTSLTADLAAANTKIATTQATLDKANADLAAALVTNATQATTLKTMQYPRHFNSLTELTTFLNQDDTNSNPAYSGSGVNRAYILEIKAQRAGFILPAYITWDSSYVYFNNIALVGGTLFYTVNPFNDVTTYQITLTNAVPSYPIPLP